MTRARDLKRRGWVIYPQRPTNNPRIPCFYEDIGRIVALVGSTSYEWRRDAGGTYWIRRVD